MKIFLNVCAFILGSFLVTPLTVFAADNSSSLIQITTNPQTVGVGKKIIVSIVARPGGVAINAVEGSVFFDPALVLFDDYTVRNSLVDLWIVRPNVVREGRIDFAGIIPGGTEASGLIAEFEFISHGIGDTTFRLGEITLGLQNSAGFVVNPTNQTVSIKIEESGSGAIVSNAKIEEKPQFYPVEISRNTIIYDNGWFVSFLAKNANEYFIQESSLWEPLADDWIAAESPYILEDQKRGKYIFIKARDEQGNETVMKISPQWFRQTRVWLAFALIISGLILIFGIITHKRHTV